MTVCLIFSCAVWTRECALQEPRELEIQEGSPPSGRGLSRQEFPRARFVFADLNGDGWLDLLVATPGAGVLCS